MGVGSELDLTLYSLAVHISCTPSSSRMALRIPLSLVLGITLISRSNEFSSGLSPFLVSSAPYSFSSFFSSS